MPDARSQEPDAEGREPAARGPSAYLSALRLLARRELSEAQVRQRLARKGHPEDDIEAAVVRLKSERAINDARVAEAIARTAMAIKRRGKLRVRREIEQAGIAPAVARQALDTVFEDVDDDALLDAALRRRLRGDRPIADDREFQRLYRYLSTQGFESDRVVRALRARRAGRSSDSGDPE
jgi:regulatory protein